MPSSETRSFTLRRQGKERDPIPFDIDGLDFEFFPDRVNGFVMMDVSAMSASQDSRPMWEFFEMALGPEGYPRFREHVRSPDIDIQAEDMKALLEWMMEESSERPPTPSTSSAGGRSRTSRGSTAT